MVEYIYQMIVQMASLSLQQKLWLNKNNDTGFISSYSELLSSLFDDFGFDDFVENIDTLIGFSDCLKTELNKLRIMLNNYQEKDSDEEIINDPEWILIVKQAKVVIEEWNKIKF